MLESNGDRSARDLTEQLGYSGILERLSTTNQLGHNDAQTSGASDIPGSNPARDLALVYCKHGSTSIAVTDYEQAKFNYDIAIEYDPGLGIAHSGLARVYSHLKDYRNALESCNRAIGCNSQEPDFYYQRAVIARAMKDSTQVLADCEWILAANPEHHHARWLNAITLVKTENYQLALENLNIHLASYPEDANAYCYRGICYDRADKLQQSIADFDRAIGLQSDRAIYHHARGRTRQRLGDLRGALADLNLTLSLNPLLMTVYDDLAEVYRCLGDYRLALQNADRAIKLNPQFIEAYFRRGLTYTEMGNLELALADYSQTIALNSHHLMAYIQRSWIYFRQDNYQLARADCDAVRSFDKDCFWANYMLGIINSFSGFKHDAIDNFSKAIEIFPYYVAARYHRGLIYYDRGDILTAMADFKQARVIQDKGLERLVERDETGFYAEGLALYHQGQSEAAHTVLTLGALSAKRFNNISFHEQILSIIESLGL